MNAKGGRRLIQDDDTAPPEHGASDRQALALTAGHLLDIRIDGRDLNAKVIEHIPCSLAHRPVVYLVKQPQHG